MSDTGTMVGWTCGKCGRRITSATILGGIYLCALCANDVRPQWACSGILNIPLNGPGSHAWDLAEQRAQRERADKAERRIATLEARIAVLCQYGANRSMLHRVNGRGRVWSRSRAKPGRR